MLLPVLLSGSPRAYLPEVDPAPTSNTMLNPQRIGVESSSEPEKERKSSGRAPSVRQGLFRHSCTANEREREIESVRARVSELGSSGVGRAGRSLHATLQLIVRCDCRQNRPGGCEPTLMSMGHCVREQFTPLMSMFAAC